MLHRCPAAPLPHRGPQCDCPGLVFPSFVSSREEMVVNGVLPIDQLRDHIPPMEVVCHRVSRFKLENYYGLQVGQ